MEIKLSELKVLFSEEAIQKRLASIKAEIKNSEKFDYKIINDTVENAVKSLEKIINP